MKCSNPSCSFEAISVCTLHNYAVCQNHESHHTKACNSNLVSPSEYQRQILEEQIYLNKEHFKTKSQLIAFLGQIQKSMKTLLMDLLNELDDDFKQNNLEGYNLEFTDIEAKYISLVIRSIIRIKRKIPMHDLTTSIQRYDGKELIGLFDQYLNGVGIIDYKSDRIYKGTIRDGRESGIGQTLYKNGSSYFGEFHEGMKSGIGVSLTRDNSGDVGIYEGFWEKNLKSGYGKMIKFNDYEYEGDFLNNEFEGIGFLKQYNNTSYKGQFKYSKPNGQGIYKTNAQELYSGNFINGKLCGYGYIITKHGRYDGEIFEFRKNGPGRMSYNDGRVEEGIWENDVLKYLKQS